MTALETIREIKSNRHVTIRKIGYGQVLALKNEFLRLKDMYSFYLDSEVKKITYGETIYIEVEHETNNNQYGREMQQVIQLSKE